MEQGLILPHQTGSCECSQSSTGPVKRRLDPPQTPQTKSRIKDAAFSDGSHCERLSELSGNVQLLATATERPAMETHWPELEGDCILI